jgi:AmmeMemoRadiSam system protein B
VISQIRSPLVILFGVAHRARDFGLQDKIIFDRHTFWKGPYGKVPVSKLRESIMNELDEDMFILHDSIQNIEHSLEALVPFLQYYNNKVEIVPILVPFMSYDRMLEISKTLASAIITATEEHHLQWGKDFSILISNDAVHYGDEDWGGNNYAPFGSDTSGYNLALMHEKEIISSTLCGSLDTEKVRKFCEYTVQKDNYKEYKWTWCGRYAIPLGLLTGYQMAEMKGFTLKGASAGYLTSIDHPGIPVEDLGMGTTAPANIRHWVGYVGVVYK